MGNLILSRSFTVDDQDEDEEEELEEKAHTSGDEHQDIGNTSLGSAMDVDAPASTTNEHLEEEESDDGDEDEETNTLEIAMVPLADILNARYQCENVRVIPRLIHSDKQLTVQSRRLNYFLSPTA
jgi:SET domain-containing protein 6